MRDGAETGKAGLDALMYRMLGGLLLLGAGVLLALTLFLLALPRVESAAGPLLVLPGTGGRHTIAAMVLPVLGAGILVLGLPGLLALALARGRARFRIVPNGSRTHPFLRPLLILGTGATLLAVVLLRR